MDKTIKEVADELGVSKDKIKYRCKKLPSNYLYKVGKITYIKNEGIKEISKIMGVKLPSDYLVNLPSVTHQENEEKSNTSEQVIEILKEQLITKDNQINELNNRLKEVTNALVENQKLISQQQTLALIDKKKEEETEIKDKKVEVKEENKVSDPVQKKSFWSKLFGRK